MKKSLVVCYLLSSLLWADTVYLKTGRTQEDVKVKEETAFEIVYTRSDSNREINVSSHLVDWIKYEDAPYEFLLGRNAFRQGSYEEAIESLELALTSNGIGKWIKEYANFYIAKSYHQWANSSSDGQEYYEKAIEHYKKVRDAAAQTRFLFATYLYEAQCYHHLEEWPQAIDSLEGLKRELQGYDKDPSWQFQGLLWFGHILRGQEDYNRAINAYEEAERFARQLRKRNLMNEANLEIGKCYIDQKTYPSAIRFFQGLIQRAGKDGNLRAQASNGLATCYLAQKQYLKARSLAIKVILDYYMVEGGKAEAMYIIGESYELNSKEEGAKRKAQIYYEKLEAGFGNTKWGQMATKKLKKMK